MKRLLREEVCDGGLGWTTTRLEIAVHLQGETNSVFILNVHI